MRLMILAGAVVLVPAAMWGQGFDAKPGLWESTSTTTMAGGSVQIPEDKLAAMPPEQRKMIESLNKGRTNTSTSKSCITKETMAKGFPTSQVANNCTQTTTTLNSSKVVIHMECTAQGMMPAASGDITIERIDSEHVKGTIAINATGGRGGMNSTFLAKYVGADCGDAKPMEAAPVKK
jgi:hypothetical protein